MNHTPEEVHARLANIDSTPWAFDGRDLHCTITSGTHTIAACGIRHHTDPLTNFDRIQDCPTLQDDINAHFIADAPQLLQTTLAALEQLIDYNTELITLYEQGHDIDTTLENIDQYIRHINNGKAIHS